MPIFTIYPISLIVIAFYIWLNDKTLLRSHPPICILLYTESALMVPFPSFLRNVYPVFPMKSTVTTKGTKFKRKQIGISPGFAYIEYKIQETTFKSATLNLQ